MGWLFITSGNEVPLRVAHGYSELKVDAELIEQISAQITKHEIDVVIVDPLIRMHAVNEQDNGKMDIVMGIFARLADVHDCAFEVVHHTRKLSIGAAEYNIEDTRGASAIGNSVRSARVLNQMAPPEAEGFSIPEVERYTFFKVVASKGNHARRGEGVWRHFASVTLPNGEEGLEDSDEVGVVEEWLPPGIGAPTEAMKAAEAAADKLFVDLLVKFTLRGQVVNNQVRGNYAPKLFSEEKEARLAKVGKAQFDGAMRRLMDAGRIRLEPTGPDSKKKWGFVVV